MRPCSPYKSRCPADPDDFPVPFRVLLGKFKAQAPVRSCDEDSRRFLSSKYRAQEADHYHPDYDKERSSVRTLHELARSARGGAYLHGGGEVLALQYPLSIRSSSRRKDDA